MNPLGRLYWSICITSLMDIVVIINDVKIISDIILAFLMSI